MGWGSRLRTHTVEKALVAGPLLRICTEGERQHVERRASGVWSSGVWRWGPE